MAVWTVGSPALFSLFGLIDCDCKDCYEDGEAIALTELASGKRRITGKGRDSNGKILGSAQPRSHRITAQNGTVSIITSLSLRHTGTHAVQPVWRLLQPITTRITNASGTRVPSDSRSAPAAMPLLITRTLHHREREHR